MRGDSLTSLLYVDNGGTTNSDAPRKVRLTHAVHLSCDAYAHAHLFVEIALMSVPAHTQIIASQTGMAIQSSPLSAEIRVPARIADQSYVGACRTRRQTAATVRAGGFWALLLGLGCSGKPRVQKARVGFSGRFGRVGLTPRPSSASLCSKVQRWISRSPRFGLIRRYNKTLVQAHGHDRRFLRACG